MVEKSQDKEMDKSVAVGNVENNSEKSIARFSASAASTSKLVFCVCKKALTPAF